LLEQLDKFSVADHQLSPLITSGLDVQLVKQAHFLMLVARDLQSNIGAYVLFLL